MNRERGNSYSNRGRIPGAPDKGQWPGRHEIYDQGDDFYRREPGYPEDSYGDRNYYRRDRNPDAYYGARTDRGPERGAQDIDYGYGRRDDRGFIERAGEKVREGWNDARELIREGWDSIRGRREMEDDRDRHSYPRYEDRYPDRLRGGDYSGRYDEGSRERNYGESYAGRYAPQRQERYRREQEYTRYPENRDFRNRPQYDDSGIYEKPEWREGNPYRRPERYSRWTHWNY